MRELSSLNPKFTGLLRANSGEGLTLDCPICGPRHRMAVYFANPIDGKPSAPWQTPQWQRTGETIETLTIEPSIQYPCFHGWIEDGKVIDIAESPRTIIASIEGNPRVVALSPRQAAALAPIAQPARAGNS